MTIYFNNAHKTNITIHLELDCIYEMSKVNNWKMLTSINYSTSKEIMNNNVLTTKENIDCTYFFNYQQLMHGSQPNVAILNSIQNVSWDETFIGKGYSFLENSPYFTSIDTFQTNPSKSDSVCSYYVYGASIKKMYDENSTNFANAMNSSNTIKIFKPFTLNWGAGVNLTTVDYHQSYKYKTYIPFRGSNIYCYSAIFDDYQNQKLWVLDRTNDKRLGYYVYGSTNWKSQVRKQNSYNDWLFYDKITWNNFSSYESNNFLKFIFGNSQYGCYFEYGFNFNSNLTSNDLNGIFPTYYKIDLPSYSESIDKYWNWKLKQSSEFNIISLKNGNTSIQLQGWDWFVENNQIKFNIYEYVSQLPTNTLRLNYIYENIEQSIGGMFEIASSGVLKTSSWNDYMYTNSSQYQVAKSYADENLKLTKQQNKLNLWSSGLSAVKSVLFGGVAEAIGGAIMGAKAGGAGGAVAGGVVGGVSGKLSSIAESATGLAGTVISSKKSMLDATTAISNLNAQKSDLQRNYTNNYQNVDYSTRLDAKNYLAGSVTAIVESVGNGDFVKNLQYHFFLYGFKTNLNHEISADFFQRDFEYIQCENNIFENVSTILQNEISELLSNGIWIFNSANDFNSKTNIKQCNGWMEWVNETSGK